MASDNTEQLCACGLQVVQRQVHKEGKNQGRFYTTCPKPQAEQCKYFVWMDAAPEAKRQQPAAPVSSMPALKKPKTQNAPNINPASSAPFTEQWDAKYAQLNNANLQMLERSIQQNTLALQHLSRVYGYVAEKMTKLQDEVKPAQPNSENSDEYGK